MLNTLDSNWVLDPETNKVIHVEDLRDTGFFAHAVSLGTSEWAAYLDGFVVDEVTSPRISIPDSRPGVAVNVPQIKEFYEANLIVPLERDGNILHIKEESMTGELDHLSPVAGD